MWIIARMHKLTNKVIEFAYVADRHARIILYQRTSSEKQVRAARRNMAGELRTSPHFSARKPSHGHILITFHRVTTSYFSIFSEKITFSFVTRKLSSPDPYF
ncbi:hypothetical protein AVEN_242061-1 [Araneus ventricosus]|uniref:Uncharacterized protein n=1 Tax=Araneus ventricosus TaxID=182803 RepID=A0A4Y2R5X9_ARAVE|nr:hypothetical protein AVEN_242061-1 [Araneus ventricosus]